MEEEVTMKKLCLELQVSPTTVYRWIGKGMPTISRVVGFRQERRFVISKVRAWLKKQRAHPIKTRKGMIRT